MAYVPSVEQTRRWRRTGWALAIGLLIGLSVVLAATSVRAYRTKIEGEYRAQAELMAATYARVAGRWWLRDDVEMMIEAARLMVVGSALFVRVVIGDELLLDQRDFPLADEPLPARDETAPSGVLLTERTASGVRYLDTTSPIFLSGVERPIGHVRIGFGLTSVTRQARARAWGIAGIVTACDAALIGTVLGMLVARRRRRVVYDAAPPRERALVRSGLHIDPISKAVTVRGEPVGLTPKQFRLLRLLAEVPGRVLSDDEILEAVWPDSPYADSRDVKQCVYTLRRRLRRVVEAPGNVIVNVKGYGYKLVPPGDGAPLDWS